MFQRAEALFRSSLPGIQAGVASMILHCLKPCAFPVLNRRSPQFYEELDITLTDFDRLNTYIQNCRTIKAFRDQNFSFKNYRIFDKKAQELEKYKIGNNTQNSNDNSSDLIVKQDQYSPGLSVEDWLSLLHDNDVFDENSIFVIHSIYEYGGQATCTELATKYGKEPKFYNIISIKLAKRIHKKTNCPLISDENSNNSAWLPILYVGMRAEKQQAGMYIWRLREELMQALAALSPNGYKNPYSQTLIESKNIIFRGAPGTGKSYLAKEIAADVISNGTKSSYDELTPEQKLQVEFVQFHPSYDYTDFVEGLRPEIKTDGEMRFRLKDGIFKAFVDRAKKNFENSKKSQEAIEKEQSAQEALSAFLASTEFENKYFETLSGNKFTITGVDEQHIYIFIPENPIVKNLCLNIAEILQMLESDKEFDKIKDVTDFFGKQYATQGYSYDFILYKEIKAQIPASQEPVKPEELKKYVFIIDEINRGEISKIFGELFFAIDPGYRGKAGEISTQYANLHDNPNEKFYIPENVYIIGTMNDIDRSVDSFDFAMRRRFRFIEIKADANIRMLDKLGEKAEEAKDRLKKLNRAIVNNSELNENYQIGAAYFLKLDHLSFDELWTDYLQPLLLDYVQGLPDYQKHMDEFAKAYGYQKPEKEQNDETSQD
ncbi:MAG: AAA family ATPase [Oscillospiraceae bacterium]|nr:AAA family ATPase [Oscillospiraceae bacterium]